MSHNNTAFPSTYRAWDDDEKEYYQTSTEGLTKLELISAMILSGHMEHYYKDIYNDDRAIEISICLAKKLLKKIEE